MSSIAISILPWGVVDGNGVDGIDDDGKDDDGIDDDGKDVDGIDDDGKDDDDGDVDGNGSIKSRNFLDPAHSITRWTCKKMSLLQ